MMKSLSFLTVSCFPSTKLAAEVGFLMGGEAIAVIEGLRRSLLCWTVWMELGTALEGLLMGSSSTFSSTLLMIGVGFTGAGACGLALRAWAGTGWAACVVRTALTGFLRSPGAITGANLDFPGLSTKRIKSYASGVIVVPTRIEETEGCCCCCCCC